MKHLLTVFAILMTLNVFGQSDYKSTHSLILELAHFWSTSSNWDQLNTENSRVVLTHKLDSVVTRDNIFATTQKLAMEYNALGHTTKMYQYGIDEATSLLRLDGITSFEYLIPGYPSHIEVEGIDEETQELATQLEMDLQYDGSNRLDSAVISLEDPLFGGGFGPFIGIKQVYSNGHLIQSRQWLFIALLGGWVPASITDLEYDVDDRLIEQLTSSIDFGTGTIEPSDRTTYSYNAQGLEETETQFVWSDPVWEPTQRSTSEYHSNGTIAQVKQQNYNIGNATWDDNVWTIYPIENVTNQYPFTSYLWDTVGGHWVETDSTINLLNPALKWGQVAVPSQIGILSLLSGGTAGINNFFDDPDGSSILEARYFVTDSAFTGLHYDATDTYYYSLIEGSHVSTVLPENITVSPNPANDYFTIDFDQQVKAKYTIVNLVGVTVGHGTLQYGKNKIQTSNWTPGIYYITMQLEDGTTYVHKQSIQQ